MTSGGIQMKKSNTAERLKEIMTKRNLRQVDILELCKPFCAEYGVKLGKNDLSQYISGKASPKQNKLFILSKALGVSSAWLMGFDDVSNEESDHNQSTDKELKVALFGGDGEVTDEMWDEVKKFAQYIKSTYGNKED